MKTNNTTNIFKELVSLSPETKYHLYLEQFDKEKLPKRWQLNQSENCKRYINNLGVDLYRSYLINWFSGLRDIHSIILEQRAISEKVDKPFIISIEGDPLCRFDDLGDFLKRNYVYNISKYLVESYTFDNNTCDLVAFIPEEIYE